MTKASSQEITRQCESWWAKLADSTRVEQHHVAEHVLALLGWTNPECVQTQASWMQAANLSYVLRCGAQTSLAAHFVTPGTIEPPSSIVDRGLDFCETTRLLANGTRSLHIRYAFVTDLYRWYLYDVEADELLLYADTPPDFERELAGVLSRADVERGALEELRRQPRSYAARQLREWCHRWCGEFCGTRQALPEETAFLAIDRLLVLGFLLNQNVVKHPRWDVGKRFGDLISLAFSSSPAGVGRALTTLFGDLWEHWHAGLFAPAPPLEEILVRDAMAVPFVKEFALLSHTKLTIATILESFNYGEPAEKARVRMVPDVNKERETYLAKWTWLTVDEARLELDIQEEGYRAIFLWFDKLVDLYERLDIEFEAQSGHRVVPEDLDLLAWAEMAAAKPAALSDKRRHAAERGLRIYYASSRQLRTARLMLYLHVISRSHQDKERMLEFPDLTETLKVRPRSLDADRRWMSQPAQDLDEESEVV